ncbi:MAG: hypothetical protein ABEK59_12450, partial [Halobacteria archaeon]
VRYTDSEKGNEVLDNWSEFRDNFVKVMPDAFAEVVEERMEEGVDIRLDPPPKPGEAGSRKVADGGTVNMDLGYEDSMDSGEKDGGLDG